jgi:hypothetical protein
MGLKDSYIEFEKPIPAYFPSEIVNGKLVISLSNEKKMARIKVVCTRPSVYWCWVCSLDRIKDSF